MPLTEYAESYRFWELVNLLAQEQCLNEDIVARALATAVAREGLLMHSVDPKWLKVNGADLEMKASPYVGYCSIPGGEVMVLKSVVLEHLLAIARNAELPSRDILCEEFVYKNDFKSWTVFCDEKLPHFWFG